MTDSEFQILLDKLARECQSGRVQALHNTEWIDVPHSNFLGINFNTAYRIKPQPREVFGVYDEAGNLQQLRRSPCAIFTTERLVKFREVLE